MIDPLLASYEAVPYESKPISPSHPDCMAAMATLHGQEPAPLERCRVLELGCAGGGNLIPMAETIPGGQFVGIDLAPGQIAEGQRIVDALGLTNLKLTALSILDVGDDFGEFDYIIAHGVYSWVPVAVQNKILSICARHLAPNGIAYISYNTYPGWHLRSMVREMLLFHTRRYSTPAERLQQARGFLEFLKQALGDSKTAFGELIREEVDLLQPQSDAYLFHEQLESTNQPLYFHEFVDRLHAEGLQYLSESRFGPLDGELPPALEEALQQLTGEPLRREQYLDFLRGRMFRRSLICRAGLPVDRTLPLEHVAKLRAVSYLRPVSSQPEVFSEAAEEFRGADKATLSTNNPLVKCALLLLAGQAPRAVPFESLLETVHARLDSPPGMRDLRADAQGLAELLRRAVVSGLVELHVAQPPLVALVSERPVASRLARLQVVNQFPFITNLWHRLVELNPFERMILAELDGTRDREAIVKAAEELVHRDVLTIQHEGKPLRDPIRIRQMIEEGLQPTLSKLAGLGLLIG